MSSFDELSSSIKKLGRKLSLEGRRTASIAHLKYELKTIDIQRNEARARLGEKVYDLKKRNAIKDPGLIELLQEQFDELLELERKLIKVLDEIHRVTMMKDEEETQEKPAGQTSSNTPPSDPKPGESV